MLGWGDHSIEILCTWILLSFTSWAMRDTWHSKITSYHNVILWVEAIWNGYTLELHPWEEHPPLGGTFTPGRSSTPGRNIHPWEEHPPLGGTSTPGRNIHPWEEHPPLGGTSNWRSLSSICFWLVLHKGWPLAGQWFFFLFFSFLLRAFLGGEFPQLNF